MPDDPRKLIEECRRLAAAATPGEWQAFDYIVEPAGTPGIAWDDGQLFIVRPGQVEPRDAALIARYRTLAPALADACEELLRERDALKRRGNFMDMACEHLPEDWQIVIELEEGSGCVKLINPEGDEVEMCDDDLHADEMLLQRINKARESDGLQAVDFEKGPVPE
jgi:hypothetical protein